MWLVSVLRDQTLDFRSCAFANTPKNPAGMKKTREDLHFKKYFHSDSACSGFYCFKWIGWTVERRKYLLSWEKAAAATCFLISVVSFGFVLLRYLFFKFKAFCIVKLGLEIDRAQNTDNYLLLFITVRCFLKNLQHFRHTSVYYRSRHSRYRSPFSPFTNSPQISGCFTKIPINKT